MRPYLITYGGTRQIITARSHDDALRRFYNLRRSHHGRTDIRVRPATPHETETYSRPAPGGDAA